MNPAKLACLINDTIEGIERSRMKGLFTLDKDGNVLRDSNGFPFYNTAAIQTLQTLLQAQIIERAMKYED